MYQATVAARPWSKLYCGDHPNSALSFEKSIA